MKRLSILLACAVLGGIGYGPTAQAATIYGNHIKANWALPAPKSPYTGFKFAQNGSWTYSFYTGKGVEASGKLDSTDGILIDFTQHGLAITFTNAGALAGHAFNGLVFEQLDGDIFAEVIGVTGFGSERVVNTGNKLTVNFSGLRPSAGQRYAIQFASGVPEPATWGMLLAGAGMAGAAMRRRRAVTARLLRA